ncbi:jg12679 [Pararge aegeria aegeria]|uniref:Jg12679 protein n=1 Tax=Pararge aegeria aegeria TaxID=348720 RepID=A0A8S4R0U7_9NEOP|nr:jg12679 [Pararge aegeria aegeria]
MWPASLGARFRVPAAEQTPGCPTPGGSEPHASLTDAQERERRSKPHSAPCWECVGMVLGGSHSGCHSRVSSAQTCWRASRSMRNKLQVFCHLQSSPLSKR